MAVESRESFPRRWFHVCLQIFLLSSFFVGANLAPARAASLSEAEELFFAGQYAECAQVARNEFERGVWNEKWPTLLLQCQLTTGNYDDARRTYGKAIDRFSNSIGLRMLGYEVYLRSNVPELAERELGQVLDMARKSPWRYSSAADRITLGKFFLLQGEDARQVLELFYDRARKSNPKLADVHIATAELALDKHDYKVAADSLEIAAGLQPENPQIYFLQARAWQESDSARAAKAIERALELNPRHVPSLLFQADHLIDAERYELAAEQLTRVLEVNIFQPEAWAYHAVIAHLQGHHRGEGMLRTAALERWYTNPNVDHLIGKKLSQKYRFAEGAAYQRRALARESDFLAARFSLSQDLLRLGEDQEGWQLAKEVHDRDGYNVVAYNLITLRDNLQKFTTLEADDLFVRMDAREARIYGPQVVELLLEARRQLCEKYEVTLDRPVTVEIFPQQQDFAIRTFGLPGGAGFLGVCFGPVITANSPASQGESPSNWRSVLWHEFCHVVTLSKTKNKMPRWLSEGISVYEEIQKDASWGEHLTPQYREMILGDELTPVSQLSAAFLRPASPVHLQFAYYESSLVVEYLIGEFGLDTLKRILVDLSVGMPINESLQRYVGSLEKLDQAFAEYARQKVKQVAPETDWERDDQLEQMSKEQLAEWLEDHPNSYWGLRRLAMAAVAERDWQTAEKALLHLNELYPQDTSSGNALAMLAELYRRNEDIEKEREVLEKLAELDDDAVDAYIRLMELHSVREDWAAVRVNAKRLLAVNPLLPVGHEMLGTAAEYLEQYGEVASSLAASLEMNPVDPAGIHFRLAQSLHRDSQPMEAKRHVLMALEEAPRYRAAQKLLLELIEESPGPADPDAAAVPIDSAGDGESNSPDAQTAVAEVSDEDI